MNRKLNEGRVHASERLLDLRWAYQHLNDEVEGTWWQEEYRRRFKDPAMCQKMESQLDRLEDKHAANRQLAHNRMQEQSQEDLGTDKVIEIGERLIQEWEKKREQARIP